MCPVNRLQPRVVRLYITIHIIRRDYHTKRPARRRITRQIRHRFYVTHTSGIHRYRTSRVYLHPICRRYRRYHTTHIVRHKIYTRPHSRTQIPSIKRQPRSPARCPRRVTYVIPMPIIPRRVHRQYVIRRHRVIIYYRRVPSCPTVHPYEIQCPVTNRYRSCRARKRPISIVLHRYHRRLRRVNKLKCHRRSPNSTPIKYYPNLLHWHRRHRQPTPSSRRYRSRRHEIQRMRSHIPACRVPVLIIRTHRQRKRRVRSLYSPILRYYIEIIRRPGGNCKICRGCWAVDTYIRIGCCFNTNGICSTGCCRVYDICESEIRRIPAENEINTPGT